VLIRLLLVGASGAVGQQVLQQALADPRVAHVIAVTRRPLPQQSRLENHVVDFFSLPTEAPWWQVDAVICTLGTTIKAAGSEAAFAAVDRDLPILVAKLARDAGATRFGLNSSLGADLKGNFYLRTKAQAEAAVGELGYPGFTIVRPSLIDTVRSPARAGESIALFFAQACRPLISKRYRAVKPESIARALLDGVLQNQSATRIVESEELI